MGEKNPKNPYKTPGKYHGYTVIGECEAWKCWKRLRSQTISDVESYPWHIQNLVGEDLSIGKSGILFDEIDLK